MSYVRQSHRNRETGTVVEVVDLADPATEFEAEDECRWATLCRDHGSICTHPTLALARSHAADPAGWCEPCRADPPVRRCPGCDGEAPWADDAWVCRSCGDEWYPEHFTAA